MDSVFDRAWYLKALPQAAQGPGEVRWSSGLAPAWHRPSPGSRLGWATRALEGKRIGEGRLPVLFLFSFSLTAIDITFDARQQPCHEASLSQRERNHPRAGGTSAPLSGPAQHTSARTSHLCITLSQRIGSVLHVKAYYTVHSILTHPVLSCAYPHIYTLAHFLLPYSSTLSALARTLTHTQFLYSSRSVRYPP